MDGILRLQDTASGTIGIDFGLTNVPAVSAGWIQARNPGTYASNINLALQPNGGNVGIGTTSPVTKLQIDSGDLTYSYGTYYNTSGRYNGKISALATMPGRQVNDNPDFLEGTSGYSVYDNGASGSITLSIVSDTTAPSSSGRVMNISHTAAGSPSPGFGGFYKATVLCTGTAINHCIRQGDRHVVTIWAKIPSGYGIAWASNSMGTGGNQQWLSPTVGTGNWEQYIMVESLGAGASSTNFFYISGPSRPFNWQVASVNMVDIDAISDVDRAGSLNVGYKMDVTLNNGYLLSTNTTYLATDSGNVGIGNVAPSEKLSVTGNLSSTGNMYAAGSQVCTAANGLCNSTGSGSGGAGWTNTTTQTTTTLKVGIGTVAPVQQLDVVGTANASTFATSGNFDFYGSTPLVRVVTGPGTINIGDDDNVNLSAGTLYVKNDGNVGVGTIPGNKLTILATAGNDGIHLTNSTGWMKFMPGTVGTGSYNNLVLAGDNAIIYTNGVSGGGAFVIAPWAGATSGLRMDGNGNVGIGAITPSQKLHVVGAINTTTGIYTGGPIYRTATGKGYLDGQYSGVETSATSGAIYSIGGAYVPGTTTLGNMYGIGYGYSGNAGIAVTNLPASKWGMYVASSGTSRIFLDSDAGNIYINGAYNGAGTGLTGTASSLTAGAVTGMFNGDNGATDLNATTVSGFYRINGANPNRPGDWGQLLVIHGASDTITQLYGAYNTGHLMTRSGNPPNVGGAGSYTSWLTLLDSGNYNSYSPTLTGTGASGSWNINAATVTNGVYTTGSTMTGALTFSNTNIELNRAGYARNGISWYSSGYPSWSEYMSPAGTTSTGPHGDLTAPSGTLVTSWAKRSYIENAAGYGWTFESAANTATPAVVAEIRSSDGSIRSAGTITATTLQINGNANITGDLYLHGNLTGYDLSEFISGDGTLEAGDVVEIDTSRDEAIVKSTMSYSTKVVGIVSTDPGIKMNKYDGIKNKVPLVLSGRVPIKVNLENGAIKRGDLLTTSNTPGYAMKCNDKNKCTGALVGKAMQNYNSTEPGKIIAIVMLG